MKEFELKYGCNPNQKPSKIYMANGSDLPIEILNGKPGYINFLDAFNSWQLVKEIKAEPGTCNAHVQCLPPRLCSPYRHMMHICMLNTPRKLGVCSVLNPQCPGGGMRQLCAA